MDTKPWHRQPLVWMLIVIPLSAVIASMITIWLAITSDDGLVADDYYWQGKQINRTLARDRAAHELGLGGWMALPTHQELFSIELQAQPDVVLPDTLTMDFLHSTRAGHDQEILLRRVGERRYQGVKPALAPGNWHLQLGNDQWRLHGELFWPAPEDEDLALELRPAALGR